MEYATLKLIWWFVIGVLMIGYAILDGYDLGVAGIAPFVAKEDRERRIMLNTIAPHWDGNQVWLIALGGCVFAGWPQVYATSFSGFYFGMLLILYVSIVRPLCLEYRVKVAEHHRKYCDLGLFIGGSVVPLIAGVAIGNLFTGFGFSYDDSIRSHFTEGFWGLLRPFPILCGLLSICMLWMQGSVWIGMRVKKGEPVRERAVAMARVLAVAVIVLFAIGGLWIGHIPGYEITNINPNGPSNPLNKTVVMQAGGWLANYSRYPVIIIGPILGFLGAVIALLTVKKISWLAFVASSLSIAGIIATAGMSLFPFLMPSSTVPGSSLTVWDASSSYYTLSICIGVAFVFISLIILYTIWCHWKMWRRIGKDTIDAEGHSLY